MKQISFLKVFVLVAVLFTAMLKVSAQEIEVDDDAIILRSKGHRSTFKMYPSGGTLLDLGGSATTNNALKINVNGSNERGLVVLNGWTTPEAFEVYGSGLIKAQGLALTSDANEKDQIEEIPSQIDNFKKLKGVSYKWKDEKKQGSKKSYGLLAQDLQKIYPEMVFESDSGGMAIYYTELIPVLIQVTQEQQAIIEKQAKMLADIEKRLLKLEKSRK